ncbi:hypothetical protein P4O66_003418 [Electrophorus voltai]|uniref:MAM domain-containing protein n=1 Tax=Electrophorus voltai TaxID=2609070 RepID=A0AAD8YQ66_9TELE|nr:hypothetical protein P4O66_003418 [Electrophorus voltai]
MNLTEIPKQQLLVKREQYIFPCLPVTAAAGCTFEVDTDAELCDYRQGQEDDFDWQLVRTDAWTYVPPELTQGEFLQRPSYPSHGGLAAGVKGSQLPAVCEPVLATPHPPQCQLALLPSSPSQQPPAGGTPAPHAPSTLPPCLLLGALSPLRREPICPPSGWEDVDCGVFPSL